MGNVEWQRIDEGTDFAKYKRTEVPIVAGRITDVEGKAEVRALEVTQASQSYEVAAPVGATLIFRDLYWPGYGASLDGERLEVSSLADTLLRVELPSGSAGKLTVSYEPVTGGELVGLTAGGGGVTMASMLTAWRWRRRHPSA